METEKNWFWKNLLFFNGIIDNVFDEINTIFIRMVVGSVLGAMAGVLVCGIAGLLCGVMIGGFNSVINGGFAGVLIGGGSGAIIGQVAVMFSSIAKNNSTTIKKVV